MSWNELELHEPGELFTADETLGAVITVQDVAERLVKHPRLLLDLIDAWTQAFSVAPEPLAQVMRIRDEVIRRGWPVEMFDRGLAAGMVTRVGDVELIPPWLQPGAVGES